MSFKIISVFIIFQISTGSAISQTYLVLESKGRIRPREYPIGSSIKVHFKGEPKSVWDTYTILGFDSAAGCIRVSVTYCVSLTDIDGFDITPAKGNKVEKAPSKFYIQWTFFQYFNGQRKLNTRNRLRIIDQTPDKPGI